MMWGSNHISDDAARNLTLNSDPWLSCDDCFNTTDVAIEQLLLHATPLSDPFRTHLLACGVCRAEARSLLGLLALDSHLNVNEVLTRFDRELST
jgi:hypothetical protein